MEESANPSGGDDPPQELEWRRQNTLIYGGLIAIGVVLVQPFLAAGRLDASALVCVIAFAVAIPLLAVLILLGRQEEFRRRASTSMLTEATKVVAELCALAGVVAGFWHITWIAGVVVLISGVAALVVHTVGYGRLERTAR